MKRVVVVLPWPCGHRVSSGRVRLPHRPSPGPRNPFASSTPSRPAAPPSVLARMVADQLATTFKQQFFVETRAGATGPSALRSVIAARAGWLQSRALDAVAAGHDSDHESGGRATIRYAISPTSRMWAARRSCSWSGPSSGIKTFADFMARARSIDRPLTYSSSGLGGNGHLMTEFFGQRAGVKVEHVPYKGASRGLVDLIGGHIAFSAQTVASAASYIRSGILVPLANTADARLSDYPICRRSKSSAILSWSLPPGLDLGARRGAAARHRREDQSFDCWQSCLAPEPQQRLRLRWPASSQPMSMSRSLTNSSPSRTRAGSR